MKEVFSSEGNLKSHLKHKLILATDIACASATRLLHPGMTNTDITRCIESVARAFSVQCVQGVLSHRMKRYVMDGQKSIIQRRMLDSDPIQDVETFDVCCDQIYNIDIAFALFLEDKMVDPSLYVDGLCALHPHDTHRTTIYRKNEIRRPIRLRQARRALGEIQHRFLCFPFVAEQIFQNEIAKSYFAVKSLAKEDVLDVFPVLEAKREVVIARSSCTAAITENAIHILCGDPQYDLHALLGKYTGDGVPLNVSEQDTKMLHGFLSRPLHHERRQT